MEEKVHISSRERAHVEQKGVHHSRKLAMQARLGCQKAGVNGQHMDRKFTDTVDEGSAIDRCLFHDRVMESAVETMKEQGSSQFGRVGGSFETLKVCLDDVRQARKNHRIGTAAERQSRSVRGSVDLAMEMGVIKRVLCQADDQLENLLTARRISGWTLQDRISQRQITHDVALPEFGDEVILRREIQIEGSAGHVGPVGNVTDCRRRDAFFQKQSRRHSQELLAPDFRRFAYPFLPLVARHGPIIHLD